MLDYDALIYLGSSYRERLSEAFRRDVDSGERPVLWLKENIDQLTDPQSFSGSLRLALERLRGSERLHGQVQERRPASVG